MSPPARRSPRWLAFAFLALGGASVVLVWVVLALHLQRQAGWMALLAAADVVLMLRLGGMPAGRARALLGAAATAAVCALALWGIAATHIGFAFGLNPWDSVLKLGFHHACTLVALATTPRDWLALAAAPVLAAWWTR